MTSPRIPFRFSKDIQPVADFTISIALGQVPGWTHYRKFGMNDDVDSGIEYVWPPGTERILPTAAAVVAVVSDSAEDDPDEATPPGTGGWTVTLQGLDANYDQIEETVTLAGLTPANTTQEFLRVHRAFVVTAGSTEANVGNISMSIGGDLQAYIEAVEGQTHQLLYTIPRNHTLAINNINTVAGRLANTDVQVILQYKPFGTDTAWRSVSDLAPYESQMVTPGFFDVFEEKGEIRMRIDSTATNTQVGAEVHGFLIDNDYL